MKTVLVFILLSFTNHLFAQDRTWTINCKLSDKFQELRDVDKSVVVLLGEGESVDFHFLGDTTFICKAPDTLDVLISSFYRYHNPENEGYFFNVYSKVFSPCSDTLNISFPKECEYNINRRNNTCPKCHKKDRVIPILYGLRFPIYKENGEISPDDIANYYSGDCSPGECPTNWYCEKDKLEF